MAERNIIDLFRSVRHQVETQGLTSFEVYVPNISDAFKAQKRRSTDLTAKSSKNSKVCALCSS